jgi:hypothetical protein
MTNRQVYNAMQQHRFIAVRWASDYAVTGVNCAMLKCPKFKVKIDDNESRFVGFYPISFQEYIRIKTPFKSS